LTGERRPARLPAVLTMLAGALLATAWAGAGSGQVEFRVTDHAPAIEQFRSLSVVLRRVEIHRADSARREGWLELVSGSPAIDIVPLKDGVTRSLGTHRVPAGRYDAVRVRFAELGGELESGARPPIEARDTVVAIELDVPVRQRVVLLLDLYAEDQTEHEPPRYVVKVREVRRDD